MEEVFTNKISTSIYHWLNSRGYQIEYDTINITLITIVILSPLFYTILKKIHPYLKLINVKRDLSPFLDRGEVLKASKYYITTKGQNISPTNDNEPRSSQAFNVKESIIPFYLKAIKKNSNVKYYLILADSGMGKSTFLINLYLEYTSLVFPRRFKMIFIPLAHPGVDDFIKNIADQENIILLLDGFDEDPKAGENYKRRLDEIVQNTWKFRHIFLTSRTQFFPSENHEPYITQLYKHSLDGDTKHYFKKLYISPFDDKDVKEYLNMKFPRWKLWTLAKRSKAKRIISLVPNLMVRPMLLSYIDTLVTSKRIVNGNNKITKGKLTVREVYGILINRWILREANRIDHSIRKDFINKMYDFSAQLALYMFETNSIRIPPEQIINIADKNSIELTELELKGKSLLNRDAAGYYKFAHKSILEYFLAKYAIDNPQFGEAVLFYKGMEEYDQASLFCTEFMVSEIR